MRQEEDKFLDDSFPDDDFLEDDFLEDDFPDDSPEEPVSRPHKEKSHTGKKRRRKKKRKINGHAIFLTVLAVLLLVTVIRLLVWNAGKKSEYDPDEVTDEFDVELLDYIQPLDPSVLEGRPDDGVTTVLAFGNDILADDRSETGLCALMEEATGATIYNCAFPGSTIAMKNAEYNSNYPLDGLSLYWTVAALCNQNYDLMDVVVGDLASESALSALETLKSVDLEKVDALLFFYDLQDYSGGRIVYDKDNDKNLNTVYGALNASIQLIQETYPYIRIYMLSQPYGTFLMGDGTVLDASRDDIGNGLLTDYINWELEVVHANGISFIDNYYGSVTLDDADCLTDGFHLNEKGRQKVAAHFADIFGSAK